MSFRAVNSQALPGAQNLLSFLYEIKGKYTLSGQHDYISSGTKYADAMESITGRRPAVWGSDLSFEYEGDEPHRIRHCGPLNLTEPGIAEGFTDETVGAARGKLIERVKMMHGRGHIITLMWHHPFPTYGNRGPYHATWAFEDRPDAEAWEEMTTEGTELYGHWKRQADQAAGYLKELRDADIPVLWRPYHEMNGVWFWWCKKPGLDGFRKLWVQLYEYFTDEHKLNNLLWVWNPNAPRDIPGDEAYPYADYYPGNDFVDVLAADVYRKDWRQSHHDQLLELGCGKPVAIGETADLLTLEQLEQQNHWTWFMPWGVLGVKRNTEFALRELYESERVINLNDIKKKGSR